MPGRQFSTRVRPTYQQRFQRRGTNLFCDYCKKPSHVEADCWLKQRHMREEQNEQQPRHTNDRNTRVTFDPIIGRINTLKLPQKNFVPWQRQNRMSSTMGIPQGCASPILPSKVPPKLQQEKTISVPLHRIGKRGSHSLKIKIARREYDALIYTGADLSFVSLKFMKSNEFQKYTKFQGFKGSRMKIETANGQRVDVLGVVDIEVFIQEHPFRMKFGILKDLTSPIILGQDFMMKYRTTLEFKPIPSITLSPPENFRTKNTEHPPQYRRPVTEYKQPLLKPVRETINTRQKNRPSAPFNRKENKGVHFIQ